MLLKCICCHYIYYIKYQAKWSNKRLFAFYKNTLLRKAIYKIGITPLQSTLLKQQHSAFTTGFLEYSSLKGNFCSSYIHGFGDCRGFGG